MSKYCEKQSPQIGDGYFYCQLLVGHGGKHQAGSQHTEYENPSWIVRPGDNGLLTDKVKRLERENAALRKVVEAIREMFAFGPEWRVAPIAKALAELDAGEGG